jgi:ubiquinone/menaquinone biosynthesis C-methylase UbiE
MSKTSWQPVHKWYSRETRDQGHYYHEHVILPNLRRLIQLKKHDSVLDLACGAGVFGRSISATFPYLGIDIAPGLIEAARKQDRHDLHTYIVGDITAPWELFSKKLQTNQSFSHAVCILAIQNIQSPLAVFQNASHALTTNGTFILVMNHPAFRIPRQSSWGVDETNKLQYRKINRYMSPLEIPMTMHPGKGKKSPITWSYHFPLSSYITWLSEAGFVITGLEEWTSDKESQGTTGKMENRSRSEIPLFLTIVAKKN